MKMIDSSYSYKLKFWQKYSLCWFQMTGSKFLVVQQLQAEVQLLRVQCESTVITGKRSTQDDEHLCKI